MAKADWGNISTPASATVTVHMESGCRPQSHLFCFHPINTWNSTTFLFCYLFRSKHVKFTSSTVWSLQMVNKEKQQHFKIINHSSIHWIHRLFPQSEWNRSTYNQRSAHVLLTCRGLQEQQGEEAADRDSSLHDGCQENSDRQTGYIYKGKKVKGHAERRGWSQQLVEGQRAEVQQELTTGTTEEQLTLLLERSQLRPQHQCRPGTWSMTIDW